MLAYLEVTLTARGWSCHRNLNPIRCSFFG